jgi:hypothetical protein
METFRRIELLLFVLAYASFIAPACPIPQKTSKAEISETLKSKDSVSVYVFDHNGTLKDSVKLTPTDKRKFKSLEEFVRSKDSPIDSCKNPVPTTPPPQCVICDDGQTVCTKAKFSESLDLKRKSD